MNPQRVQRDERNGTPAPSARPASTLPDARLTPSGAPAPSRKPVLIRGGLRSVIDLGADRPHGTRLRYMAGCKCFQCRRANSDYERERKAARAAGDWNGLVDASAARRHLRQLARQGIGRRIVAEVTGVAMTTVIDVRAGRKTRIRARTERKLLAVTTAQRSDAAIVSAAQTWRLIEALLQEGFTKARIARELGAKMPALQIHRERVTVKTAAKVEALWRKYQ